jgi:hypothetical protein
MGRTGLNVPLIRPRLCVNLIDHLASALPDEVSHANQLFLDSYPINCVRFAK